MSAENVLGKYAQRKAPAVIHMHLQAWILSKDASCAVKSISEMSHLNTV